jgi:hypothetical protein
MAPKPAAHPRAITLSWAPPTTLPSSHTIVSYRGKGSDWRGYIASTEFHGPVYVREPDNQ